MFERKTNNKGHTDIKIHQALAPQKKTKDLQKIAYQENTIRYNDFTILPLNQTLEELKKESEGSILLHIRYWPKKEIKSLVWGA